MKKMFFPFNVAYLLNLFAFLIIVPTWCQDQVTQATPQAAAQSVKQTPLTTAQPTPNATTAPHEKSITVNYENEPLINIINQWSELKGVNVLLPQAGNEITAKVTLQLSEVLSIDQAWTLLYTLVDLAGYSLTQQNNMFVIVKNSASLAKEALPIYIGMPYEKLPNSEEQIRYLYYLANVQISEDANDELRTILKNVLPEAAANQIQVDSTTNSILITAKSSDIKGVMPIIKELDQAGFHETLEFIKLYYTNAPIVAELFNQSILKPGQDINRYRLDARKDTQAAFFSQYTRIIAAERVNSLILLGQPQAVARIKDFIYKYIDIELESGKSILHVYQMQYLDADNFAGVLKRIVESTRTGGTGQARAASEQGIERTFEDIIIASDKSQAGGDSGSYFGGNKLIIAARNSDWKIIKQLIEQLDKPSPQVLIEVLIADLTLEDVRQLGSLIRNPEKIPLPANISAQSAQIGIVTTDSNTNSSTSPTTLQSDLLRLELDAAGQFPGTARSLASTMPIGSTVLSLNDSNGKTWSILQILKQFGTTKILSHPHVIATNNQQAEVSVGQTRLLRDESVGSTGGTTQIVNKKVDANLTVKITPRISSANSVNIQVKIDINQFKSDATNTRIKRVVETNANIVSGDVLALGGLIKVDNAREELATPILSRVPILGNLFAARNNRINKTNLTVFISPTIIEPRLRSGIGEYTQDYINVAKTYSHEGSLFDGLKDPVTRWFFKTGSDSSAVIDGFMEKDEFKSFDKASKRASQEFDHKELQPSEVEELQEEANIDKNLLTSMNKPAPTPQKEMSESRTTAQKHTQKKRNKPKKEQYAQAQPQSSSDDLLKRLLAHETASPLAVK